MGTPPEDGIPPVEAGRPAVDGELGMPAVSIVPPLGALGTPPAELGVPPPGALGPFIDWPPFAPPLMTGPAIMLPVVELSSDEDLSSAQPMTSRVIITLRHILILSLHLRRILWSEAYRDHPTERQSTQNIIRSGSVRVV